jgi:hypothetical protein
MNQNLIKFQRKMKMKIYNKIYIKNMTIYIFYLPIYLNFKIKTKQYNKNNNNYHNNLP